MEVRTSWVKPPAASGGLESLTSLTMRAQLVLSSTSGRVPISGSKAAKPKAGRVQYGAWRLERSAASCGRNARRLRARGERSFIPRTHTAASPS